MHKLIKSRKKLSNLQKLTLALRISISQINVANFSSDSSIFLGSLAINGLIFNLTSWH
jgi:hypothetical protein